jgi:hypothetical protein
LVTVGDEFGVLAGELRAVLFECDVAVKAQVAAQYRAALGVWAESGGCGVGERVRALEELRDVLWDTFLSCGLGVKAQVAAQYRGVLVELRGLVEPVGEVSRSDELAQRRKDRRAAAKVV